MTAECTNLDHSDYKVAGNFHGLERIGRRSHCEVCGRPEFWKWFNDLYWHTKNPAYWKQIFKDAEEQLAFFWKCEPRGGRALFSVYVDGDVDDVRSILIPTRPDWARGNLTVLIQQERYKRRQQHIKDHTLGYGEIQSFLEKELRQLIEKNDLEYVDNYRYAAMDVRKDMRRYRKIKDKGCCGSFDAEVTIAGRKYMVGCNYGH
jgi:hypothetical protein